MSPSLLLITVLVLSGFAYFVGVRRAFAVAGGPKNVKGLHSRPTYYGSLMMLWAAIPALIMFGFWLTFEDTIITHLVVAELPAKFQDIPADKMSLVINDIKNLASGNIASTESANLKAAATHYSQLLALSHAALAVVVLSIAVMSIGGIWW